MSSRIEGVVVRELKLIPNERGRLLEVQRRDDPGFPGFGQAYVTSTLAGVVKAWYRHARQVDQLATIVGLVKLVLFDDRSASPTRGVVEEIVMGERQPRLVLIPPGIWHGFQALSDREAFNLHLNDEPFDFQDPDEDRLPADSDRIPYRW